MIIINEAQYRNTSFETLMLVHRILYQISKTMKFINTCNDISWNTIEQKFWGGSSGRFEVGPWWSDNEVSDSSPTTRHYKK